MTCDGSNGRFVIGDAVDHPKSDDLIRPINDIARPGRCKRGEGERSVGAQRRLPACHIAATRRRSGAAIRPA